MAAKKVKPKRAVKPPATPERKPSNIPAITQITHPADRWHSLALGRIAPERMAHILKAAKLGDTDAYLTLAEEMEEKEPQYGSVLQTRKLDIAGAPRVVTPANKTAKAAVIAEEMQACVIDTPEFDELLFDLMDALGKGYSVVQPIWDTSVTPWVYKEFKWWDPRFFRFDRETMGTLGLYNPNDQSVPLPLPPGFVVHYPKTKTGIKIRGGLAIACAPGYCYKTFNLADWAAFNEVYGMPLRVGYYEDGATGDEEKALLRTALANLGHDAAAMLPDGMKLEVLDARRPSASGKNVFEGLCNYWDAQTSKIVLGQTMTTDDGSSKSQADVHARTELKIARADARSLAATVMRGVLIPWVYYNYGPEAVARLMPGFALNVEPPEDLESFTKAALPWVQAGMRVKAAQIRAKFNLEEPEEGDEDVLGGLTGQEQADREDANAEADRKAGAQNDPEDDREDSEEDQE